MANQTIRPLIEEAVKVSMKNRDKETTSALRMAISELKKEEIDKKIELEDEQVIQILQRMIKQEKIHTLNFQMRVGASWQKRNKRKLKFFLNSCPNS